MQQLTEAFEIHDQDRQGDHLDNSGHATWQSVFAGVLAELSSSGSVGLTHVLFKWFGLPQIRISDIKLHIDGDLDKFQTVYSMMARIAKQKMATGSSHHNHYADDEGAKHYVLAYY
eukprot:5770959-Pyramimonas_sp.AAC.1